MSETTSQSAMPNLRWTWVALLAAIVGLVLLCVWVLHNQASAPAGHGLGSNAVLIRQGTSGLTSEAAQRNLAAQEKARAAAAIEAKQASALAELREVEKQIAAEKQLLAQQREAANREELKLAQAELAAEQRAAELLAAEEASAQQRLAAEQIAAEQIAAEQIAAEQRLAEQRSVEQRSVEQRSVEQRAARQRTNTNTAAQNSVPRESAYDRLRREELSVLPGLSAQIQFLRRDMQLIPTTTKSLDRVFELLFLYSEATVAIEVASNEYQEDIINQQISRERALVLIDYLVDRGIQRKRFTLMALGKGQLPTDSHRVQVKTRVVSQ